MDDSYAPPNFTLEEFGYASLTAVAFFFIILIYSNAKLFHAPATTPGRIFAWTITVTIPEIIIWLIAFRGAVHFKKYANNIRTSKDGKCLNDIANALLVMVLYVITLTMSSYLVTLAHDSHHVRLAVRLGNGIPLLLLLISSVLFFQGARCLTKIVPLKQMNRVYVWLTAVLFIALSVLFAWKFYQAVPHLPPRNGLPRFIMPVKALLAAYVLPYIVAWGLGLFACLCMANYSLNTKGIIYKRMFQFLYKGTLAIFLSIYLAQFFVISDINLDRLSLPLMLIYGLLIIGATGFILIYEGSKKLTKLETA